MSEVSASETENPCRLLNSKPVLRFYRSLREVSRQEALCLQMHFLTCFLIISREWSARPSRALNFRLKLSSLVKCPFVETKSGVLKATIWES